MKLLFTRRQHIGSWLIRTFTWSEYSHVDIVLDDKFVLGAMAPDGVVIEKLHHRIEVASKALVMDIPVKDISVACAWANSQIHKPYDWWGVVGIGLHRNWQEDDKWSCAELVAMALSEGGQKPFDSKFHHRITPQDLLKLNFKKTKIK